MIQMRKIGLILLISSVVIGGLGVLAISFAENWVNRNLPLILNSDPERRYDVLFERVQFDFFKWVILIEEVKIRPLSDKVGTVARAELKTLEEFYFGGTHLCHQFEANRAAQVDSLFAYAQTLDKPVILAGDFNFTPDSPEYKRIPSHWKEAGAVAGNTQNTYGTAKSGARIDYIWYDSRKFELVEYKVLDVPHSDHYPVWAILRMKKETP